MTQIVLTTVINHCSECPNCKFHEPYDGDADETEVYCSAVKENSMYKYITTTYSPNDIVNIPNWCPLAKNKG